MKKDAVVLVGDTKEDALDLLKDNIFDLSGNDIGFGYNQELTIEVSDKASGTKKRKNTSSAFDFGL